MMSKILITPRSLTKNRHPALNILKKAGFELIFSTPGKMPSEEELVGLIKGCSGYLAGVERISKIVLENADKLKVISRNGTGIDNIDIEEAKKRDIKIFRAAGANSRGVAELTITLLFSLVRAIPIHDGRMKVEVWDRNKGIEVKDRTLGVIGCGRIGKEVSIMALGLGMNVLAYDIYIDKDFKPGEGFSYVNFEEAISRSDLITLHLPANKDSKPIITENEIASMKRGVYIINTARASLVDLKAIVKGLDEKRIYGYAVDVYSNEPPVGKELELIKRSDVIATPHIGGYTEQSINRAAMEAVENLLKVLT